MAEQKPVGKISHFFSNINVAVVELTGDLSVGDEIHVKGATTDFTIKVDSMQIEHNKIEKATKGQSIGLKVPEKVRSGDIVYKVE